MSHRAMQFRDWMITVGLILCSAISTYSVMKYKVDENGKAISIMKDEDITFRKELYCALEKQTIATTELTVQVRVLTDEVNRLRERR